MESSPAAVLLIDPDGRIVMANAEAGRMFGYTKAELVGQLHEMLIPDGLRVRHVEYSKAFLEEPKTRPMGNGLRLTAVRKGGKEFPVEISLNPIQKENPS